MLVKSNRVLVTNHFIHHYNYAIISTKISNYPTNRKGLRNKNRKCFESKEFFSFDMLTFNSTKKRMKSSM